MTRKCHKTNTYTSRIILFDFYSRNAIALKRDVTSKIEIRISDLGIIRLKDSLDQNDSIFPLLETIEEWYNKEVQCVIYLINF